MLNITNVLFNSVIQVLFHCESFVNEIRNYQLRPTLQRCLDEYGNVNALSVKRQQYNKYYFLKMYVCHTD